MFNIFFQISLNVGSTVYDEKGVGMNTKGKIKKVYKK